MPASYGGTVQHWRGYCEVDVSTKDNGNMSVRVRVYMQSQGWGYRIDSGISAGFSSAGGNGGGGGSFSSGTGATVSKCFVDRTVTIQRKQQDYNTTISWSVSNSSGYHNGTSSGRISIKIPAVPSHKLTFNLNHGSGNFPQMTKYWGYPLFLPTNTPTRTNYSFVDWLAGSTHYKPGQQYRPDADTTFIAQWRLNHKIPALGNVTVERCAADGTPNDDGTYAKVTAPWEVLDSDYTDGTGTISVVYVKHGGKTWSSPQTTTVSSGTSGEATVICGGGNLATGDAWDIKVTFNDGTLSVAKIALLTRPFIPLEFAAQGAVVSFGAHVPDGAQSGVWVRGEPVVTYDKAEHALLYDDGTGAKKFAEEGVVLYDNPSTGYRDSVTLSDSLANYREITIDFHALGNLTSSTRVYNPNGKFVPLFTVSVGSNKKVYINSKSVTLSGNRITTTKDTHGWVTGGAVDGVTSQGDTVAITRVVGYKY